MIMSFLKLGRPLATRVRHTSRLRGFISPRRRTNFTKARSNTDEAFARESQLLVDHSNSREADNRILKATFDTPNLYKISHGNSPTGLFLNPYLKTPEGLLEFASRSNDTAQYYLNKIISAQTEQDYLAVINDLDRLSDTLCRVIDLAEFVRIAHPDGQFVMAANAAHQMMFEKMNILNTSKELYNTLSHVMHTKSICSGLSEEEKAVGWLLLYDFEKSGANLSADKQERFVTLSNNISIHGHKFLSGIGPGIDYLTFNKTDVYGLDPLIVKRLEHGSQVRIPSYGQIAHLALRTVHNPEVRKQIWLANKSASDDQVHTLEQFLRERAELASMLGSRSYADYILKDKMAHSPENVSKFLSGLLDTTRPQALQEISNYTRLNTTGREFNVWDRDYYASQYLNQKRSRSRISENLSSYFSVGSVMVGLSELFSRLYGVRLVPRETSPGETWHPDVSRLDVISDSDGWVGLMYCDLFNREGKHSAAAHFTVRCSRKIYDGEETAEDVLTSRTPNGEIFQLPTIALMCDFKPGKIKNQPPLLQFHEVETLFHEMGHAIHSMLGRTKLHNVSGTRCVTDFVELPSVLMEHFAGCYDVLSLFARHYETDKVLPKSALDSCVAENNLFKHSESYNQMVLSVLDQAYHSETALEPNFDSTKIYHEIQRKYGLFPDISGSRWHAQFGHLFGYGATYYSYLLDRVIASLVWKHIFSKDPLSRKAGEKFKSDVLKWGGGRDPWHCVADALDSPELEQGGAAAMEKLGKLSHDL